MSFCDLCYSTTVFKNNIVIPSISSIVTRLDNIKFIFLLTGRDDSRKLGRPQESGQSRRSKLTERDFLYERGMSEGEQAGE